MNYAAVDLLPWGETTAPHNQPEVGAFARFASAAHDVGLVAIPTAGDDAKRPLVRWGQLSRQPRKSTLDRWACRYTEANIAYLPSPSGLVVVDIDDWRHEDLARKVLSIEATPLVIASGGRGLHFPLRTEVPVRSLDLRRYGIVGEIKGMRSIVVGPGSRHPHTGRLYQFLKGDWNAFAEVPWLDVAALERLMGHDVQNAEERFRSPQPGRNPVGTRNASTFAFLRQLGARGLLSSEAEAIAVGLRYNLDNNDPPEPDDKVIATAKSAWRYVAAGRCKAPTLQYAKFTCAEHAALRSLDAKRFNYTDATVLYLELRMRHGARAERGECFAIAATQMAEAGIIPGWTDRKRFMKAVRGLIACGLIERVEPAALQRWSTDEGKRRVRGLRAAQYRFVRAG